MLPPREPLFMLFQPLPGDSTLSPAKWPEEATTSILHVWGDRPEMGL